MDVFEKIKQEGLLFDGGMGSMLIAQGLQGGEASELWNLTHPERILNIHKAYFDAGADVATANTFGASPSKLAQMGVTQEMAEINRAGVRLAREAARKAAREAGSQGQYVAGDIGSLDGMLAPMGTLTEAEATAEYARQAAVLEDADVDLFVIETLFDLNLAVCAVEAIRSASEKPVICTMTFKQTPRGFFTIVGNGPEESMARLVEAGASAVGANCSIGSDLMVDLAARIRASVDVPVIVQPNAGMPERKTDGTLYYPEGEAFFAENIAKIKALGVEIVGGCCGTTPGYIRKIKDDLEQH